MSLLIMPSEAKPTLAARVEDKFICIIPCKKEENEVKSQLKGVMRNGEMRNEEYKSYRDYRSYSNYKKTKRLTKNSQPFLVPGAGLEPAQPQWPKDFKSFVSTIPPSGR